MTIKRLNWFLFATSAVALALIDVASVRAQDATSATQTDQNNISEIIVTARKREESILDVPVIENVITGQQMERLQTIDLHDLATFAPGFFMGNSVLSIGELVSIRGVGTSSFDPGIDQSVSLNIDGLSTSQGLAYASGLLDVGQVEVLKGPQGLFFGKSTIGGVLSLRTADPTDKFEVSARGGYEFEAYTNREELIVSGPVTDTLKARLAGMYSSSAGYYYNDAVPDPGTGAAAPRYPREGNSEDYQFRGTVLWDPDPKYKARLKLNFVHDDSNDAENFQLTSCPNGIIAPLGIPFIGGGEDCVKNRIGRIVDYDPAVWHGILNGGVPFLYIEQKYGTLEQNYDLTPKLTATSVTSYYHLQSSSLVNGTDSTYAAPAFGPANPDFHRHDFTEEVRLNSNFSSAPNFTFGAFFQNAGVYDHITVLGNTLYGLPADLSDGVNQFSIKTYSVFGQLRWQITPQLELAPGARWTHEWRDQEQTLFFTPGVPTAVNSPTPSINSNHTAPEVTLTYKPTDDLTLFAAYKQGYQSGSFSIATPASLLSPATCLSAPSTCKYLDNAFGDERAVGGEGGIRGRLFDRQLTFSLAAYDYLYEGLQVGAIEPFSGGIPVIRTVNAGAGRSYGLELDLAYRPVSLEGLTLNGSVDWNHARFTELNNVPCYGGQTIALGCNQQFNPATGLYFAQNLAGLPFVRAPDTQVNLGFDYDLSAGDGKRLILSNNNHWTSTYLTNLGFRSDYYQKDYIKTDLSLALQGAGGRWEVAVIGKNLNGKLTSSLCVNSNFMGGSLGGQVTGGTTSGPGGIDQVGCYMDPGREVWLRLTWKPFN